MAGVLKKLFLVEFEEKDLAVALVKALTQNKKIGLEVSQYAAVGDGSYRKIWQRASSCSMSVSEISNYVTYASNGVVEVHGCIVGAMSVQPCAGLTHFKTPIETLYMLGVNLIVNVESGLGYIATGHAMNDNGSTSKVIDSFRLPIMGNDFRLIGDDALRAMGLPEKLVRDKVLLEELSM